MQRPAPRDTAQALGRGWTARQPTAGAGALALARQILQANPASHDGLSLAIAGADGGRPGYSSARRLRVWSPRRQRCVLLQPIAMACCGSWGRARLRVKLGAPAHPPARATPARTVRCRRLADQGAPPGSTRIWPRPLQAPSPEAQITAGGTRWSSIDPARSRTSAPALIRRAQGSGTADPDGAATRWPIARPRTPSRRSRRHSGSDPAVRQRSRSRWPGLGDEAATSRARPHREPGGERGCSGSGRGATTPQARGRYRQGLLRTPIRYCASRRRALLRVGRRPAAASAASRRTERETPGIREAARLLRGQPATAGSTEPAYLADSAEAARVGSGARGLTILADPFFSGHAALRPLHTRGISLPIGASRSRVLKLEFLLLEGCMWVEPRERGLCAAEVLVPASRGRGRPRTVFQPRWHHGAGGSAGRRLDACTTSICRLRARSSVGAPRLGRNAGDDIRSPVAMRPVAAVASAPMPSGGGYLVRGTPRSATHASAADLPLHARP
jgi:hypothetical protein